MSKRMISLTTIYVYIYIYIIYIHMYIGLAWLTFGADLGVRVGSRKSYRADRSVSNVRGYSRNNMFVIMMVCLGW